MKNRDSLHRLFDSWQYVMLAVAIFIAIIFCCYYIVSQSRWGFYTSGGIHDVENPVFSPLKEVDTDGDKEAETKRAYLTFDDGPSGNTGEILDILDANDVKATFFVVGRGDEYYDTYRDIVGRGHTLALHSYTHDYDKIYASLDDFAEDIEELRNLLYDVTGVNCVYYRFPGGSSNTVSKVDMDTLID